MHDATPAPARYAGIDTHKDTNMLALLDEAGRLVATKEFPTGKAGYEQLSNFIADRSVKIGVEGACSYGKGIARHLSNLGYEVFEMSRPKRQQRRRGKSDESDAIAAAKNLRAEEGIPIKSMTKDVEDLHFLLVARKAAVKNSTAYSNRMDGMLVCADDAIRERFSKSNGIMRARAICSCRLEGGMIEALKSCARALIFFQEQADELEAKMLPLVLRACPALIGAKGVGTVVAATLIVTAGSNPSRMKSEAAFSMWCGTSPIPASSGKTDRHRLNRGGDRSANQAIHEIARVRMAKDDKTRSYIERKISEGKSKKEAIRCLCRYVAREAYNLLTAPQVPLPAAEDLAKARKKAGFTQAGLAEKLGIGCARIACMESGRTVDGSLMRACAELLDSLDSQYHQKNN